MFMGLDEDRSGWDISHRCAELEFKFLSWIFEEAFLFVLGKKGYNIILSIRFNRFPILDNLPLGLYCALWMF